MINASTTPPVPAPRTKTHQRMNSSSSAAGNPSSIGDGPSHTSPARKPKSSHPWLTLVHPGPWKLLPPAAPVTPPASTWFKPRAPPRNPFGEVADDDAGGEETPESTGQTQPDPPEENAPDDDPQNNPSDGDPAPAGSQTESKTDDAGEENESTSQTQPKRKEEEENTPDDDPQNNPSDGNRAGSQSDADDAAPKSNGEEPAPAEKPVPPKRRGSRGGTPQPASEDSTPQRDDEPTDPFASSGTGRTADDASDAPPAANTVTSTEVEPGVFHFSGTVSGDPELEGIASGIPDWKGAAKSLGAAVGFDVAGVAGALGVDPDDAAGGLNPFETPDFSDAAGAGLGIPHLGGENGMGGAAKSLVPSDMAEALLLTKSASVPAISSALPQNPFTSDALPEEARESFSKVCKENPFDRTPGVPKSQTFQTPPPKRATAPGYGFPLIKRKVQTDSVAPVGDLEEEMGQLDRQVETLDLKGMELEKKLRNSQKDDDEEKMLMDWLTIIRQKHVLVRRDAELLYLTKQKHLEERQADVEYGLRCLLNKPESDWSQEDRGREQQLMDELVTIIEQRNHIISSLDQDRQSEREEDLLFEAMMKRKDLQKEGLKELKKSRGKFKLMKVLKMLSQKSETAKDPKDKKKS